MVWEVPDINQLGDVEDNMKNRFNLNEEEKNQIKRLHNMKVIKEDGLPIVGDWLKTFTSSWREKEDQTKTRLDRIEQKLDELLGIIKKG